MCKNESIMKRTQVRKWYNRFKQGREDVYNRARARQQQMKALEAAKKMILENHRITKLLMVMAYHSAHAKQFLRMF